MAENKNYRCEYCNKEYKSKGNLKTHQEKAKFCLELRSIKIEQDKEDKEEEINKCDYCSKILTTKNKLEHHKEICRAKEIYLSFQELNIKFITYREITTLEIKKKDEQLYEYREQIKNLQNQINEMAFKAIEKYSITNNHQTNNNNQNQSIKNIDARTINMLPFNLFPEQFQKTLEEKFSETHLMKGQKGVAEFMIENVLVTGDKEEKKYLMKCTDPSRRMFITLDNEGKVMKDVNAENLTRIISGPVKEQCHKIYQQIQDRFFTMYESISNELEEGDKEKEDLALENERLDYATNKVCEISRMKNNNTEFVKNLISPLSV